LLCRGAGIPTLTLEHAPFAIAYDGILPPHLEFAADRMAVIGEQDRRQYLALGVAPERLVVTGCPAFDSLRTTAAKNGGKTNALTDIALFGQNHTWTGPRSLLALDPDAWAAQLGRFYAVLGEAFPAARIRIKPHPAEPFHDTDKLYLQSVPAAMKDRVELLPTDTDNATLILDSALVISFSSTIWLEARILGRPCAFFSITERSGRLADDVRNMGGIWISGDGLDFIDRFVPHLPRLQQATAAPADCDAELLAAYAGPATGTATGRVVAAIEDLLAAGAPPVEMPTLIFDRENTDPRRLWPAIPYADYVHLQTVADEAMIVPQTRPLVLAVMPDDYRLAQHMPVARVTGYHETIAAGSRLPFADGAFDVVVAPDLWARVAAEDRAAILAEMLRVAGQRVITSTATAEGSRQYAEIVNLLGLDPDHLPAFSDAPDPESIARIIRQHGANLRLKSCHQVASWMQAMILEGLGLEYASAAALRSSLQAAGYSHEHRGIAVRTLHIITVASAWTAVVGSSQTD